VALAALSCVTTLEPTSSLEETARMYRDANGTRALAVAADADGRRVWGVYEAPFQRVANERAVKACTDSAAQRGVQSSCYLIAESEAPAAETMEGCRRATVPASLCKVVREIAPLLKP
jgi:hypothetical protein